MCTIFTITLGGKVLFANNEDNERSPNETFIAFVPSQEIPRSWSTPSAKGVSVAHGLMLLGVIEGNQLLPQGGVNDKGLCYDINGLPATQFKGMSGTPWREWFNSFDILWHCSTIADVETWYLTHEYSDQTWYGGQLHFADSNGDAMVLSIGPSGEYVFTKKGDADFLVSTNFNLAEPEGEPGYPCSRFETATQMLGALTEESLTVEACTEVLDAVHIEYRNRVGTVYSNVFDLVSKKAYVYHLHDFANAIEFDLARELRHTQASGKQGEFRMVGSNLFSALDGVRIHKIEDLFSA